MKRWLLILLSGCLLLSGSAQGDTMRETLYLAGGCFWGMEHLMSLVPGVTDAQAGYAQGTVENPTYEQVCAGNTGHRETVKVTFDPARVSAEQLMKLYFSVVDPLTPNRQGNDAGTQYQAGIFWRDEALGDRVRAYADKERLRHRDFFIEIEPLGYFFPAEDYHQDYLVKNPLGYCHIPVSAFARAKAVGERTPAPKAEYRAITPQDALAMKANDHSVVFLDVRTEGEYERGHLPDAVNLPLDELPERAGGAIADKGDTLIVYCRSGARSRTAAKWLVQNGYTGVYDLGGIVAWSYDIER